MTPDQLRQAVDSMPDGGPYLLSATIDTVSEVDGVKSTTKATDASFVDLTRDIVATRFSFDLGDDFDEPMATESLYALGHVHQREPDGTLIGLDVGSIASTSMGIFCWLRGAVAVTTVALEPCTYRAVIQPREILAHTAPQEAEAMESALAMSNLALLNEFTVDFRLIDSTPTWAHSDINWPPGVRADGVTQTSIDATLRPTKPREFHLDTPDRHVSAELYLLLQQEQQQNH